jgi:hypothetical protein
MKLAIACLVIATLTAIRVTMQMMWNTEHTGEGVLGYEAFDVVTKLAMAVLFGFIGVYSLLRRSRR